VLFLEHDQTPAFQYLNAGEWRVPRVWDYFGGRAKKSAKRPKIVGSAQIIYYILPF
jgi:hypothetical protein